METRSLTLLVLILAAALNCSGATNRIRIVRLLPTSFGTTPRIKATVPGCLPMTTSWAAFTNGNLFVQALNLGPMFGNTETNQALWPKPGPLTYISGVGGMTVESCIVDSTRWIYRFAEMEYVPGYDIPPAPPISSRGKSVKAVASRKTVKTKGGEVPSTPPVPPVVSVPTKAFRRG